MTTRLTRQLLATAVAVPLALAALGAPARAADGNILLIVLDDFGQDAAWPSPAWPATTIPRAPQPNLTALANRGITFGNMDVHMECSPTRAAIMTGQHAFRPENGVGQWIDDVRPDLPDRAVTLFDAFNATTAGQRYRRFYDGKLHLYHWQDGANAPKLEGGIPDINGTCCGALKSWYNWKTTINGVGKTIATYATTYQADVAIAQITKVDPKPYFISLDFNAPHTIPGGYERPPNNLHDYDGIAAGPVNDRVHFDAVVQALDTEVGRVLRAVDYSTTTVLLLGDNGTAGAVHRLPYGPHCKSSIYQCGLAVPFVIAGKGVTGTVPRVDQRFTQDVDLFPTILQLAGIDPAAVLPAGRKIDGRSIVPYLTSTTGSNGRIYNFSETFNQVWNVSPVRSLRDARYKVITRGAGREFYDLRADPHEGRNLLPGGLNVAENTAYTTLLAEMAKLLATR